MKDGPNIVGIAALVGDHARAEILTALMTGEALTATELTTVAGVTKQTLSAHLAKLVDAQLLAVEKQGRHRYFRLADRDVAHLLETLMGVAFRVGATRVRFSPREPALRKARVCYDHLAGDLGVLAFECFESRAYVRKSSDGLELTEAGRAFCNDFGIDVVGLGSARRALCRACLDWSVRRHHLAGALGAAFLQRCFDQGWARRDRRSRVVSFTAGGERSFRRLLAIHPT
jgi:DNA-binding transcriptional ArsR family regulator